MYGETIMEIIKAILIVSVFIGVLKILFPPPNDKSDFWPGSGRELDKDAIGRELKDYEQRNR
jgi:hypothetical protein